MVLQFWLTLEVNWEGARAHQMPKTALITFLGLPGHRRAPAVERPAHLRQGSWRYQQNRVETGLKAHIHIKRSTCLIRYFLCDYSYISLDNT